MKREYTILYEPIEDGWIIATVPELPGAVQASPERLIAKMKYGPVVGPDRQPMFRTLVELAKGRYSHDRHHLIRIAASRDQLLHGS